MQGNIDFTGSLSGSIAGGGGGGTNVTITPTLEAGTKIADYTIDSTSGSLYAPTPEGLTAQLPLDISDNVISIDLSAYDTSEEIAAIYATQASVNTQLLADRQYEDLTFQRIDRMSDYQPKLTAGANINIDSNNVISTSIVTWNYSTNEVNTGQKWIDGKDIYIRTFSITPTTLSTGGITIPDIDLSGAAQLLGGFASYSIDSNAKYIPISVWRYNDQLHYAGMAAYIDTITVKYTKSA